MAIVRSSPYNRTTEQVWKTSNGIWDRFPARPISV